MGAPEGKFVWTARVGEKGQIVIPKEAREIFDMKPGDTILLLGDVNQGLALVNNSKFIQFAEAVFQAQANPSTGGEEES